MTEAVIVGGVRTPFVKAGAAFNSLPAQELGRLAVRELLDRTNLDPARVDELICGNVASPVDAANVARVIALRAGIPRDKIAHTVSRNCASGFECVTQAVDRVVSGRAKCVVAVGVDSMSHIPLFYPATEEELKDMFVAMARKLGTGLDRGDLPPIPNVGKLSGADVEGIVGRAWRRSLLAGEKAVTRASLAEVLADFLPSTEGLEKELQEVAAVLECTDRAFLLPSQQAIVDEVGGRAKLQERLTQLKMLVERL